MEIHDVLAFPKREKNETGYAVGHPFAVVFRFHGPTIGGVSAAMLYQATLIRQAKSETLDCFFRVCKFLVPSVERDRVRTRGALNLNRESTV